jgi:thioredoxin-like negative regulator of GroEL
LSRSEANRFLCILPRSAETLLREWSGSRHTHPDARPACHKDYPAAVRALRHYVSLNKNDATAFYLLSRAYSNIGDAEQSRLALAQFEKTSRDEKTRNRARKEMEAFSRPALVADLTDSTDLNPNDH